MAEKLGKRGSCIQDAVKDRHLLDEKGEGLPRETPGRSMLIQQSLFCQPRVLHLSAMCIIRSLSC